MDLNQRPHPYQGCALTTWATGPSVDCPLILTHHPVSVQQKISCILTIWNERRLLSILLCHLSRPNSSICIFIRKFSADPLYPHPQHCYNFTAVIKTLMCLFHPDSRTLFQPGLSYRLGRRTMDLYMILQLLANLCVITEFVRPLVGTFFPCKINVTFQVSIIRNKKHDQCSRTDRALDDR